MKEKQLNKAAAAADFDAKQFVDNVSQNVRPGQVYEGYVAEVLMRLKWEMNQCGLSEEQGRAVLGNFAKIHGIQMAELDTVVSEGQAANEEAYKLLYGDEE